MRLVRDSDEFNRILREEMKRELHTIPVPSGWSVEQAWEAIRRGDRLFDEAVWWCNVWVVDGHLIGLA